MEKNIYSKWEPIEDIPARLSCEGLHHDYEGFRILLKGPGPDSATFRIIFDPTLAYRNIDEGDLLKTIHEMPDPGIFSLFTVDSSTWLKWFHEESYGIHKDENIVHYAIYTVNDCIDVLSAFEPTVEWLNP